MINIIARVLRDGEGLRPDGEGHDVTAYAEGLYLGSQGRRCINAQELARDTDQEVRPVLALISCPECYVTAEVTDRFSLPGTGGPVDHVALRCAAGHHFRMPSDMLPTQEQEQLPAQEQASARPARDLSFRVEVPVGPAPGLPG